MNNGRRSRKRIFTFSLALYLFINQNSANLQGSLPLALQLQVSALTDRIKPSPLPQK